MKFNKTSVIHYLELFIAIILLIIVMNVIYKNSNTVIDIEGKNFEVKDDSLIKENGKYYISYSFIKENVDGDIYFDKISKKVVISSESALIKAKVNDAVITNNFNEEELSDVGVIEKEDKYILLEILEKAYGYNIQNDNNVIYMYKPNSFKCELKINNVRLLSNNNIKSGCIKHIDLKDKITGIYESGDYVFIKVNDKNVGYVDKDLVKYTKTEDIAKQDVASKKVYIYADNTSSSIQKNLGLDGVILESFNISKSDGSVSEGKINKSFIADVKSKGYEIYGTVTNGYKLAGFNTSTTTQLLSDEKKRNLVINNLIDKVEQYKLDGIAIDFRRIKDSDKDNYLQFVKELNALNSKKTILIIEGTEYKNYVNAINFADLAIVNMYGLRDINSTVSGTISDVTWIEKTIIEILKVADNQKTLLGLPFYSILWTEKNSTVIESEIYKIDAVNDYINKNKLQKKYNENVKQNYIEFSKGILTYKMWVEDEISMKSKVELVKTNELAGICIYKLGYENKDMLGIVNSIK